MKKLINILSKIIGVLDKIRGEEEDNMTTQKRVVIDPGHGGRDPGATTEGVTEKSIVLGVGMKIKDLMDDSNIDLFYTRENDSYISLSDRSGMANRVSSDIFVSLHANAAGREGANGIETFHFPGSDNGQKLAGLIQSELIENTGATDRGVKTARFHVLQRTTMPAVLVEMGFVTNPDEREKLILDSYQEKLAESIVSGINQYF